MIIRLFIFIFCFIVSTPLFAQHTESIDYCQCTDEYGTVNPIRDGKYVRTCNGKMIETGQFSKGKKHGEWITYSTKGQLIRKFSYANGQLHGPVQLFYPDGTAKVSAYFTNGLPDSSWQYFTPRGKVWITGTYQSGAPQGQWVIRDKKGNSPVSIYDYTSGQYVQQGDPAFLKNMAIVQNDNTHEYFILHYPQRMALSAPHPLGGFLFASDLFVYLMEVPADYWNTYASLKYQWHIQLTANHIAKYSVTNLERHMDDDIPVLPFIINTNRDSKLKSVDHSAASRLLLDDKIAETLSLLPPWINEEAITTDVYVPYVINQVLRY